MLKVSSAGKLLSENWEIPRNFALAGCHCHCFFVIAGCWKCAVPVLARTSNSLKTKFEDYVWKVAKSSSASLFCLSWKLPWRFAVCFAPQHKSAQNDGWWFWVRQSITHSTTTTVVSIYPRKLICPGPLASLWHCWRFWRVFLSCRSISLLVCGAAFWRKWDLSICAGICWRRASLMRSELEDLHWLADGDKYALSCQIFFSLWRQA